MSAKIALNAEDLDRRKRIRKLFSVLRFLLIFIFLAIFLFPVYWIAIGAFKSEGEFYHYPPIFWPEHFNWGNFGRAMTTFGGTQALVSSLIVAITNTMLVIAFGVLLAYAMGRFNVGGDNLSFFVLSLLFAPPVIAATPLFIIFKTLGADTYPALFFLHSYQYASQIMKDLEDIPHGIENAALWTAIFAALQHVTARSPWHSSDRPLCLHLLWNEFLCFDFHRFIHDAPYRACKYDRWASDPLGRDLGTFPYCHHAWHNPYTLLPKVPCARADIRCCERVIDKEGPFRSSWD